MWYTTYRNGRLTGRTTDNPTRDINGAVCDAVWYDDADKAQADFMWQQHDACHNSRRADGDCPHCQANGWPLPVQPHLPTRRTPAEIADLRRTHGPDSISARTSPVAPPQ